VNGVVGPTSSSFTSLHFCFLRNFDFAFLKFRMTTTEGSLMQASAKRCRRERGQQHTAVQSAAAPAIHLHIPVFLVVKLLVSHSSPLHCPCCQRSPSRLQEQSNPVTFPFSLLGDLADFAEAGTEPCDVKPFGRLPGDSSIRCFLESLC
jgi:hypothetical protein